MRSLKWFLFKTKLKRGDFYTPPRVKFPIKNGDKVWIGENAPTDTSIKIWVPGTENKIYEIRTIKEA